MDLKNDIAVFQKNTFPGRPTLVFLHDSLGCIRLWRDFPEKLGELTRCNIFVYDRYGYGESAPFRKAVRDNLYMHEEADILVKLLDLYHVGTAILFGHSDGGSIALIAAGKYPGRFEAVITEGAHIFVEEETLEGIREAIVLFHTTDLKVKLEKYHGEKTEDMFWAWAGTWNTPEFRHWTIEDFLPGIICPVLVIQGDQDEYGTAKQVKGIADNVSGISREWFPEGVKHTPHKEAPLQVLDAVSSFLRESTGN